MRRFSILLSAALLATAPASFAATVDELLSTGAGTLNVAPLPAGPVAASTSIDQRVIAIFAMPDGKILAIEGLDAGGPQLPNKALSELLPDGSLRRIATLPGNGILPTFFLDMDLDSHGRFYLLMRFYVGHTGEYTVSLLQIDPVTGATVGGGTVPEMSAIATAPRGLWANAEGELRQLDTDTLTLGPAVAEIGPGANNLEADSAGRLYFNRGCAPPCSPLGTIDPAFGGPVQVAPDALLGEVAPDQPRFTIRRSHYAADDAIYLQGGRFRAEVEYTAFDGASGPGHLAPAHSAETGIFWFFSPDNWELMAKVLDGCALNGNYWVFGAASTDVAYTLTVTDTETGAFKTYTNPLGTRSPAIADVDAFPCGN